MLASFAFTTPLLLSLLIALPVLWWLLRAVPPAPIRRRFPAVALLLGLKDDDSQTDKTPWWLLLLRILAAAALIVGFAGPVLNPNNRTPTDDPLLVIVDGGWASASRWSQQISRADEIVAEAGRGGRTVALVQLTRPQPGEIEFQNAATVQSRLNGLSPDPWTPDESDLLELASKELPALMQTLWISDGLSWTGKQELAEALRQRGSVSVVQPPLPAIALRPARFASGKIEIDVLRAESGSEKTVSIVAIGPDPAGIERDLVMEPVTIESGETQAQLVLDLPVELRNRIRRFEIQGERTAGAVTLTADVLKRRKVGLLAASANQEQEDLLASRYYLNRALTPTADVIEAPLEDILLTSPDVIILADIASFAPAERDLLEDWVKNGGSLLRFAGPRLAAQSANESDPLLPVRLRAGGRSVGGAMSWGEPKTLRTFERESPFFGLPVPADVSVTAQVIAQPDPELSERTFATLTDGTPLVTGTQLGDGQIVLFHVTANAEWSTLPLSGLFVQMLERLAIASRPSQPEAQDLEGTLWQKVQGLDGFGNLIDENSSAGIDGPELVEQPLSARVAPGVYENEDRQLARNVVAAGVNLEPERWANEVEIVDLMASTETKLAGPLLLTALVILFGDIIASLALMGRLTGPRASSAAVVLAAMLAVSASDTKASDARALEATSEVVLAYVKTGNVRVDDVSALGLSGLSRRLFERTSVEPADPIMVDLETDELSFFPMLYWPITEDQPIPSGDAYAKLNQYLRTGGLVVFDTRDANVAGFGSNTRSGQRLQELASRLDIPALEPIPPDHVLTRTFYLLQDFPGRHASRDIWVEAAPADAESVEGLPFRNLNDGVTPVLVGGNDWASAWALDESGAPVFPVGRGFSGERQRELAVRFGVNLVMHVLTGNYKSDQVHVPALLERLGN